jgi:VanZ family protein
MMTKRILQYWKTVVVLAIIFFLSTAPASDFQSIPAFPNEDKLVHFLMYFTLAFVLLWDTTKRNPKANIVNNHVWIWIIGIPALFGGAMEIWQWLLTTSRTGDWLDEVVDTIGATAGYFFGKWLITHYFKRKSR